MAPKKAPGALQSATTIGSGAANVRGREVGHQRDFMRHEILRRNKSYETDEEKSDPREWRAAGEKRKRAKTLVVTFPG